MLHQTIRLYDDRDDVTLTTYLLDDSPEMANGRPRPVVLILPGGGYISCSDREGEPIAMAFAAMGYHACVLRYSVYNPGEFRMEFDQPMTVNPRSVFPNPLYDVAAAMLAIRANAGAWRVDTDKIAVCGFSAGGHNAAMYAVSWDKALLTGRFGVSADALRPAACVLGYAVTDYVAMHSGPRGTEAGAERLHLTSDMALLGTTEPTDDLLHQVSPARLVGDTTPAMFIWATWQDGLVPVAQSVAMVAALADHGIACETHIFERGPHGLALASTASAGARSELDPDAAQWIGLCARWLDKRFAPDLPAKKPWQD